jgi:hypothetical protein
MDKEQLDLLNSVKIGETIHYLPSDMSYIDGPMVDVFIVKKFLDELKETTSSMITQSRINDFTKYLDFIQNSHHPE